MKTIRALLAALVLMGALGLNATFVQAEEETEPVSELGNIHNSDE